MEKMSIEQYFALKNELMKPIEKKYIRYISVEIMGFIFAAAAGIILFLGNNQCLSLILMVIGFAIITMMEAIWIRGLKRSKTKLPIWEIVQIEKLEKLYHEGASAEKASIELCLIPPLP
jgi:hypothetical protein